MVWLVQLAAVKVERRTYYMLGHWMLFFLCAALMVWGAFSSNNIHARERNL